MKKIEIANEGFSTLRKIVNLNDAETMFIVKIADGLAVGFTLKDAKAITLLHDIIDIPEIQKMFSELSLFDIVFMYNILPDDITKIEEMIVGLQAVRKQVPSSLPRKTYTH